MLRFKAIKEFAETLSKPITVLTGRLVFPAPYGDVMKSDSVLEIFYPRGCRALSDYLGDVHGFLIPPAVLETSTFGHLLDMVNGLKVPPVFDPANHFQPSDLQHGEALSFNDWENFPVCEEDKCHMATVDTVGEYTEEGYPNPLFCKDELYEAGRAIMMKKNHDYRGGSGDPYANFRGSTTLGVKNITGILLRAQDKFQRIRTFEEKGALAVEGESVKDALIDVQNYMDLIWGLIKEKANDSK